MLWKIVRRELREYLVSFRFAVILALSLILMSAVALVFSIEYENALRDYPKQIGIVQEDGETYLGGIAGHGFEVRQRPASLAFLAGVAGRELPEVVHMHVHESGSLSRRGAIEGALAGAARVDWAFVVAVVLSFGAGVLTYRSISGELQEGTLALVLSNSVGRGTVFAGKYLAALIALVLVLAVAMVAGLMVVQWLAPIDLGAGEWAKIAVFGLVSLLYLSCAVLIGLLCSVWGRNPSISAVGFLFAWAVLVFVVPNLGGLLADKFRDTRRQVGIHGRFAAIDEEHPYRQGMDAFELAAVDRERAQARERLRLEYYGELVRQVRFGQNLTRLSPAAAFAYAAESASDGGIGRLEQFLENALRFRRQLFEAVLAADREDPESEHRYRPFHTGGSQFSERKVDLGPAKEFKDPLPGAGKGLEAATLDIGLLVLYNGLLFLAAFWRFARQDAAPGSAL